MLVVLTETYCNKVKRTFFPPEEQLAGTLRPFQINLFTFPYSAKHLYSPISVLLVQLLMVYLTSVALRMIKGNNNNNYYYLRYDIDICHYRLRKTTNYFRIDGL